VNATAALFVHDGFIGAVRFSEQKTRTEIKEAMKGRICVKTLPVTARYIHKTAQLG
jgi:hypothetical protein